MDEKLETDIQQRDRGALSFQPVPCLEPESAADKEMANSMWGERGGGGGGPEEGQGASYAASRPGPEGLCKGLGGRWGRAGL